MRGCISSFACEWAVPPFLRWILADFLRKKNHAVVSAVGPQDLEHLIQASFHAGEAGFYAYEASFHAGEPHVHLPPKVREPRVELLPHFPAEFLDVLVELLRLLTDVLDLGDQVLKPLQNEPGLPRRPGIPGDRGLRHRHRPLHQTGKQGKEPTGKA